jgi:hypothetical protein
LKVARFFAVIFAVAGICLMLGSFVISFASLNSTVKILEYPQEADSCFVDFSAAVSSGDYAALEQLLYGQPRLGAGNPPEDVYTRMIWDAFRENIRFSYTGNAYLLDHDFARDATISVLNISDLTQKLPAAVRGLLDAQTAAAEDPALLCDAEGNYKAELVEQALQTALEQLLRENTSTATHNVTVKLIHRDGRWWAVPDQTFLKTISGLNP